LQILDPALRAASVNGSNSLELSSDGELAWAMAVIYTRNMAMGMPLWDWNGGNDVGNQNPDICASGALSGFGLGMGIGLSGGETCDDGNSTNGDGCSSTCEVTP
jgi:cysteine-rich repeat protein